jgi:hypothetical protein
MTVVLRSLSALLVSLGTAVIMPALAQDTSNRSGDRSEQRGSIGQKGETGRPNVQTAQVGAGTTNGSTTGYSGPQDVTENKPGQVDVPPLPSPELCEPYQDTPAAYQACLRVSLKD